VHVLILFNSTSFAIRAEKVLLGAGVKAKLINVPRSIAQDCGLALRVVETEISHCLALLEKSGVEIRSVYKT
jgi:hypothetical protein